MSSLLKSSQAGKLSAPSPTPSTSSSSGSKRKRPENEGHPIVYSQPQETGKGAHVYTQFTYTVDYLKNNPGWYTLDKIVAYLNLKVEDQVTISQLQRMFRSPNPTNRVEWNPKDDTYRYKPKYDVRNADDLKKYLQNQKSAGGLAVKDLKDGWPDAPATINEMEKKKEILVGRHSKDKAPKTVWINDPSLMSTMDPEFRADWHKIQLPPNPDDLRGKLLAAGLKPSSEPRKPREAGPKEKKRKGPRRGGKQTNTHMAAILKDFSHLRK